MNIYECWKKVRVHILITLFFAFAVPAIRYFGKDISDVFYLSYIITLFPEICKGKQKDFLFICIHQ